MTGCTFYNTWREVDLNVVSYLNDRQTASFRSQHDSTKGLRQVSDWQLIKAASPQCRIWALLQIQTTTLRIFFGFVGIYIVRNKKYSPLDQPPPPPPVKHTTHPANLSAPFPPSAQITVHL